MEIFRKHRIKEVTLSFNSHAFRLHTNGGSVWFTLKSKYASAKIYHHLPHMKKELTELNPQTLEDLRAILVGRYIWGKSTFNLYKETLYKVLV